MQSRTKLWAGRLATGLGLGALLVLAGCYATAGSGAYYPAGYAVQPAQAVYYAPDAQAQVQVQQPQGAYYVQQQPAPTTYYVEQQQPVQQTYYVQPQVQQQPATVYVGGGYRAAPAPVYTYGGGAQVGWEHGRRQRPVVMQQGGGVPVRVEVRGGDGDHDHEHRGVVEVR